MSKNTALKNLIDSESIASAISKARVDENLIYNQKGEIRITKPDIEALKKISERKVDSIDDANTIMQLLPDCESAAQILIASILSPQELINVTLTPVINNKDFPSEIISAILKTLSDFIKITYPIDEKLHTILREALFMTGAYASIVIPENSLDDVINSTTDTTIGLESINEIFNVKGISSLGILGDNKDKLPNKENSHHLKIAIENYNESLINPYSSSGYTHNYDDSIKIKIDNLGLESFYNNIIFENKDKNGIFDTNVTITDNYNLLKLPELYEKIRKKNVSNAIKRSIANESVGFTNSVSLSDDITDEEIIKLTFKKKNNIQRDIVELKTPDQVTRESIGNATIIHAPTESIIVIHAPGDPSNHLGYFALQDGAGNFLSMRANISEYDLLSTKQIEKMMERSSKGGSSSEQVNSISNSTQYTNNLGGNISGVCDTLSQTYNQLIYKDLVNRIRNGLLGDNVEIARNDELNRLMLSRSLQEKKTQLLFIPVELMTYFAFAYNNDGTGKSLLDNTRITNGFRLTLLLADITNQIKAAIGRTKINVKLDEDDAEPLQTFENIKAEICNYRAAGGHSVPIGTISLDNISNYLVNAFLSFNVTGNPHIADVDISTEEISYDSNPNTGNLSDDLRKRTISGLGVYPEQVDGEESVDFASIVMGNRSMFIKRVLQYQAEFLPMLNDHLRKVIRYNLDVTKKIYDAINNTFNVYITYIFKNDEDKANKILKHYLDNPDKKYRLINKLVEKVIDDIEVTLPKPTVSSINTLKANFEEYSGAVETVIDAMLDDKLFDEKFLGKFGEGNNDLLKSLVKSYFKKKWISENGLLPEISSLFSKNENGELDTKFTSEMKQDVENIITILSQLIIETRKAKNIADQFQEKLNVEPSDDYSSSSYDSSSSDEDGSESNPDDPFGGLGEDLFEVGEGGTSEGEETTSETTEESSSSGEITF